MQEVASRLGRFGLQEDFDNWSRPFEHVAKSRDLERVDRLPPLQGVLVSEHGDFFDLS